MMAPAQQWSAILQYPLCLFSQVFIGQCTNVLNDLWAWQSSTQTWRELSGGPALYVHGAALVGSTVYVFGGLEANTLNPSGLLYAYNIFTNGWTVVQSISGSFPAPRAAMSVFPLGGNGLGFIISGGASAQQTVLNESWVFYVDEQRWYMLQAGGGLTVWGAAAAVSTNSEGTRFFVFGGTNNSFLPQSVLQTITLGCNAGDYSPDFLSTSCRPCSVGYYSGSPGTLSCDTLAHKCRAPFTTKTVGSTSEDQCNVCLSQHCNNHGSCSVRRRGILCPVEVGR